VSAEIGCRAEEVMVASTGVIGVPLEAGLILNVLAELTTHLDAGGWAGAARAIMTTDTFPKAAVREVDLGDARCAKVAGIAKGSGMIAPNMATMLAFLVTDAAVAPPVLQAVLDDATPRTWNAVTVDGDRYTNDTCLLFATGAAGGAPLADAADPRLPAFAQAVEAVMLELAQALVRDGEGATKFVRVEIAGAESDASAAKIARTVCESPLVKTALAGEDANWGRIAMAVGRADEPVNRDRLSIRFGELWAARDGAASPDYDEAAMSAYMRRAELEIAADVGVGAGRHVMWTCDLTKDYVAINGDYRS
jgi:glutamate N-acetyltransferase/amino-acid N-acetyltransferase